MPETTVTITPIPVQTCEAKAAGENQHPLAPEFDEGVEQFRVQDPFGLRQAIVPLFAADADGRLTGMGTAFAADPWGTFLTADHVVDFLRQGRPEPCSDSDQMLRFSGDQTLVTLLGVGLIFGTIGIPQRAILHVRETFAPGMEFEDPLAFTGGGRSLRPFDLGILRSAARPPADLIQNLPIRLASPGPRVGDVVVAVGYPQIETVHGRADRVATRVEEGMFAGYGVVTALHPQGRDRANPTPVFEVAANWPSGMSGGPVFNAAGEVVGLVSRGLEPEDGAVLGTAWATWFEALPQLTTWAPTLDPLGPDRRRGLGVVRMAPWSFTGMTLGLMEAEALAAKAGSGFEVLPGSWMIGTNDFVTD